VKSAELRDIINRGSTGSSAGKTSSCDWLRADHRRAGIRIVHKRPGGKAALRIEQIENAINLFGEQDEETTQYAVQKWSGFYWDQESLQLTSADLGSETSFLFLGEFAKGSGKINNVPLWGSP
jgi:hypothetical protein